MWDSYGTGIFGKSEYLRDQEVLGELATMSKARIGISQRHQSAARGLIECMRCHQQPSGSLTSPPVRRANILSASSNWRGFRTSFRTHRRVLFDRATQMPAVWHSGYLVQQTRSLFAKGSIESRVLTELCLRGHSQPFHWWLRPHYLPIALVFSFSGLEFRSHS